MGIEAVSYPFYRVSAGALRNSGNWEFWRTGDTEGSFSPLTGEIENWDYQVKLEFSRKLSIHMSTLLSECRFDDGSVIRMLVLVSTAGQRLRRTVCSIDLVCRNDADEEECELNFELEGETLQGDVRIDTEICLVEAVPLRDDPFMALTPGSRLWTDSVTVALEGSLSRFPMSSVSFKRAFGGIGNAAWMLYWSPDMVESNASAAIRLYLNEDSKLFREIVSCDTSLCGLVQADVLRQILVTLLRDDDFDVTPEAWPQHSLGSFAAQWIFNIFGDLPADQIRSRLRSEPGWVDARIQSYIGAENDD